MIGIVPMRAYAIDPRLHWRCDVVSPFDRVDGFERTSGPIGLRTESSQKTLYAPERLLHSFSVAENADHLDASGPRGYAEIRTGQRETLRLTITGARPVQPTLIRRDPSWVLRLH